MKIKTVFSLFLVAGLISTSYSALAGNASSAVQKMTQRDREILSKAEFGIDMMITGTVKSENDFDARGVVIPNAEVTLGAGVAAQIKVMPFKAGEEFRKGESLVIFDCARQHADLRGAKANLTKASSHHRGKVRLKSRGAAGAQEVRDAAADMAVAKSNVDGLTEVIGLCKINAPFNGRVVERHAQTHEIPAANAPIMTVVDDSTLEVDLIVPSTWLRWVRPGTRFQFDVDELGQSYTAQVDRLGAKVDAVSQTIRITGTFVVHPGNVLTGMSGTAKFDPPTN